jgi:SCP-2 sterol transfer family
MTSLLSDPALDRAPAMGLLMRLGDGFVPARARGVRATVEWRVGGERFWMRIDDGSWLLTRDELEPSLILAVGEADLGELVCGRAEARELFLSQRLTVSGDFLLAVRLPDFFGLTRRPEPGRRLRPIRRGSPVEPPGS